MVATSKDYRSAFIRDTHLGFKGSKATLLTDFLHHHRTNLYLVGDIIDR